MELCKHERLSCHKVQANLTLIPSRVARLVYNIPILNMEMNIYE